LKKTHKQKEKVNLKYPRRREKVEQQVQAEIKTAIEVFYFLFSCLW